MTISWSIKEAQDKWEKIRPELDKWQSKELTESDTRSKIIDKLFTDVLGWSEGCISREMHTKAGYLDYVLASNDNCFVIEAKKSGTYFNLPKGPCKAYHSETFQKSYSSVWEAIRQARNYCIDKNIPIGVVSNGLEIVVFDVMPSPNSNNSYIFCGKNDIDKNFAIIWNLLAPNVPGRQYFFSLMSKGKPLKAESDFSKRLIELSKDNDFVGYNPLEPCIRDLITRYFDDITSPNRDKLLKSCYQDSDNLKGYRRELESILRDRIPKLGLPVEPIETSRRSAGGSFDAEYTKKPVMEGRLVAIVGGIGAGKTTFIHRFFRYILPKDSKNQIIWNYIDLTKTSNSQALSSFVLGEIMGNLYDNYENLGMSNIRTLKEIYKKEIDRKTDGPWSYYYENDKQLYEKKISDLLDEYTDNYEKHIPKLIEYYHSRHELGTCIIFDNADQESPHFQTEAFKLAYQLSKQLNCLVLIVLREDTYLDHKDHKPFDAYDIPVYHVTAPRVCNVFSKRLQLARDENSERIISMKSRFQQGSIKCKMADVFDVIIKSLLSPSNENSIELFESLAAGDMRKALKLFKMFIRSGNLEIEKYISITVNKGERVIPYQEVLRVLALHDKNMYDSEYSDIVNLFRIDGENVRSHFVRLWLLNYLYEKQSGSENKNPNYVSLREIYDYMFGIWQSQDKLVESCKVLISKGLIHSTTAGNIVVVNDQVRLSVAGYCYLTKIVHQPIYMYYCALDTEITDSNIFNEMSKLMNGLPNRNSKEIIRIFVSYLLDQEEKDYKFLEQHGIDMPRFNDILQNITDAT